MTRKDYDQLRRQFFYKGGSLRGQMNARASSRGGQILEKGALVTIVDKSSGLAVETALCKHCKQRTQIRSVEYTKVDLLEAIPEMPSPRSRRKGYRAPLLPYSPSAK